MYLDFTVKIPEGVPGITRKTLKGVTYIYYVHGRHYDPKKGYSVPSTTTIGKSIPGDPGSMYPNGNYLKFFPEIEIPEEKQVKALRSGCIRTGAYLVIRKIITQTGIDKISDEVFGDDSGLFLDLAVYSILTENNAGQYYPDYTYNHPLFTKGMRMYSDSKVSRFLGEHSAEQRILFQNSWNHLKKDRKKIYVSYDSTNKHCQAGDVELAEFGHEKDKQDKPILNYAIAYDSKNRDPLFYEDYPGSINDVTQLQIMLEKAKGYGYRDVGFILDRGYFSEPNIHYMDRCGYEFIIMVKGMKDLVNELVLTYKGSFEQNRANSIRRYHVSGMTVQRQLFPSDEKKRYFHIYYSDRKHAAEREKVEEKIDKLGQYMKDNQGKALSLGSAFRKYFDLFYYHEGEPDEKFMAYREKTDVIDREISLCGYYVLITSEKMEASEALELYKSRDTSEKLFRGDKSYLGNRCERTYTTESTETKILIEFAALIVRSRIYTSLKDEVNRSKKKENYMTVPAALRELEKIEMIRQSDGVYRLDYAISATQKEILKAFDMTAANVREQASELGQQMQKAIAEDVRTDMTEEEEANGSW